MNESILIVDDEKEIADLIEVYLKNDGYRVFKFYNGEDAMQCINSTKLDLAILDVMLPDIDGFRICQKIREKYFYPIIMLTAKVEDSDKIMGLTIGADDYITKPFNPLEVVARVKTQLRRYVRYNNSTEHPSPANEHDIKGLLINKDTHKCTLYGQEVPLTPIEFSILWYLCENRGKVVPSEELFENVWGEKYLDSNNTVMVHIGRLREKLKEPPRKPKFIKTVWGSAIPLNNQKRYRHSRQRSQLSKKLLAQYFLTLTGFTVFVILAVFFASQYCFSRTWYPEDPLYQLLNFIRDNIVIFIGGFTLISWLLITCLFITKPLRYLDEILTVSQQLANPTTQPIVLSPAMAVTESELNLVRENALNNAKAAKDAEQRKNDLVVYLAHDLKTPLTSVIGYLTLLNDEKQISEELREKYLAIALNKAERLEDLTNEFFEITRFNLSHISLEYSKVNLTLMLEQTVFEFGPILAEKELQCSLSASPGIMLMCDPDKLQRVFDNLLRNAVNYSFANSMIEIAVTQTDNSLEIRFLNHGNTIPRDKLNRIFEQFFRLDSSRGTKSGGSGLGLAIAKEIVELHKGRITAQSENETIEFTVTLPFLLENR